MTYGLNDISLVPARTTRVRHRAECNPYNLDNMLPLFTAPMNSIINDDNYEVFIQNHINTIIPRGIAYNIRWNLSDKTFVAVSLNEFEQFIADYEKIFDDTDCIRYVCVDIANGHMQQLIDMCAKAKSLFGGRLLLMAGNIANPDTYVDYAIAGVDFVRIGIGGGSVCKTSSKLGVHYAMGSLIIDTVNIKHKIQQCIDEAYQLRIPCQYKNLPFIIADGGFNDLDKIIKALALGADYVMVGKLFAQCEEACGKTYLLQTVCTDSTEVYYPELPKNVKWTYNEVEKVYETKYRLYYGMSTKKAQVETGNTILKTEEGIEINVPILYSLSQWVTEFIDSLRSAMSYENSFNLEEFKNSEYQITSQSEYLSYYK